MSTTFAFAVARTPRDVLGALELPGVSVAGGEPEGDWPSGVRRICRRDVSTRSTELDYDASAQVLSVRMMSLASREDVALAIAFAVVVFTRLPGSAVPQGAEGRDGLIGSFVLAVLGLELAPATEALLCAASGPGWRPWRTG